LVGPLNFPDLAVPAEPIADPDTFSAEKLFLLAVILAEKPGQAR
jgi:hypothetical protein